MLRPIGAAILFLIVGVLALVTLVHLIFSLPFLLLLGGAALVLWLRKDGRRQRYLGRGGAFGGYLGRRSRW